MGSGHSAALVGGAGDDTGDAGTAAARAPKSPDRISAAQSAQSAPSFDEADLEDLTQSIREKGIIQPILARASPASPMLTRSLPASDAGARRSAPACTTCRCWSVEADRPRGARTRHHRKCPARRSQCARRGAGLQRLDRRIQLYAGRARQVIGKSRSHVANTLRLLKLPEMRRAWSTEGALTAGHARALLAVGDADAIAEKSSNRGFRCVMSNGLRKECRGSGRTQVGRRRRRQGCRHARTGRSLEARRSA